MKSLRESYDVRWRLDHIPGTEFLCLRNSGTEAAVDVRVRLRRGTDADTYGALMFKSVAPGGVVRLYLHATAHAVPPWNAVTVSWRTRGWLSRGRLRRWDAVAILGRGSGGLPSSRSRPASSVRVPNPRGVASRWPQA